MSMHAIGRRRDRRPRGLPVVWSLAVAAASAVAGACGSDGGGGTGPGPTTGSIRVTTSTTGGDVDADGYDLLLDGSEAAALEPDAMVVLTDVEAGSRELELTGLSTNCTAQGENPRAATVTAGGTTDVAFAISCTELPPVATSLVFGEPLVLTELHQPLDPVVEVIILDETGAPLTASAERVTLSLGANPGGATLRGTVTRDAVDGVARFDDLALDRRGQGYTLVATAEGIESVESEPFDITFAWASISAGDDHACGLTTSGAAYCWGSNVDGELGNGGTTSSGVPVAVSTELRFALIDAGGSHTCGIATAGATYCWGSNLNGQLGDGNAGSDSGEPRLVGFGSLSFTRVSAGKHHTCALTAADEAYCWGNDAFGQLGDGAAGGDRDLPDEVDTDLTFATITTTGESYYSCAARFPDIYCWGLNDFGQLGDGTEEESSTPVQVTGGHSFQAHDRGAVAVGADHACGNTIDGTSWCWGVNLVGQLGDGGNTDESAVPVMVAAPGITFSALAAGFDHTCGIASTPSSEGAYCWGGNGSGQIGDGSVTDRDVPQLVVGGADFTTVAAGTHYTCGLTMVDELRCWGDNDHGQLGDGSIGTTGSVVPVDVLDPPGPD